MFNVPGLPDWLTNLAAWATAITATCSLLYFIYLALSRIFAENKRRNQLFINDEKINAKIQIELTRQERQLAELRKTHDSLQIKFNAISTCYMEGTENMARLLILAENIPCYDCCNVFNNAAELHVLVNNMQQRRQQILDIFLGVYE